MIAESSAAAAGDDLALTYQGPGISTEIWGVTQVNFIIAVPGRHARELAVDVGLPVGAFMAEQLGVENTEEFRVVAARALGECHLHQQHAQGHQIDSVEAISVDFIKKDPDLLACALAKLQAD